ncbi:DUF4176 domain-containing protein [Peribacillus sp. NPDC097197]|uniref:DUF4176 domain-containing protein n=1 Tax=Peribacillus sp. NPDC097197 TaxID=3390615 RepID=UPI003D0202E5
MGNLKKQIYLGCSMARGCEGEMELFFSKEFLPIGSVVGVQGDSRRLLIIGRLVFSENHNVVKDYTAIEYPNGYIHSKEKFILFNKDDIDVLYHYGYVDEMEVKVDQLLKEAETKGGDSEIEGGQISGGI